MSGGRLNFEKLNRTTRMRRNGYEGVDDLKGPEVQPKTRPEERVVGAFKAAKTRTKEDRQVLAKLERRFELWTKASDISSLELDKLRRQIARLKSALPQEKKKRSGSPAKRRKKKGARS